MKQSTGQEKRSSIRRGLARRALALILGLALVFSSMDLTAFAAENSTPVPAQTSVAPAATEAAAQTTAPAPAETTAVPAAGAPEATTAAVTTATAGGETTTAAPAAETTTETTGGETTLPAQTTTGGGETTTTAETTGGGETTAAALPEEAFSQSVVVDGITITVTADAGVLPAGAKLQASRITDADALAAYLQAVNTALGGSADLADALLYAFDITILDADGKAVEPDNARGEMKVSFSNPDPAHLDVSDLSIYHVEKDTGTAELLDALAGEPEQTVAAEATAFSPYVLLALPSAITLYTGCGVITGDGHWRKTADCVYESRGVPAAFPTPTVRDASVGFAGWYEDAGYFIAAAAPVSGHQYYAKWNRVATSVTGSSMKYDLTRYGIDPFGISGGKEIRTTYPRIDPGYDLYYGTSQDSVCRRFFSGTPKETVFQSTATDLRVAQLASFEGSFVRLSYYVWNTGSADISGLKFGAAADVQIGKNDCAPLSFGGDSAGSYVIMTDGSSEFRLYYDGSNVTPVSTLWTGRFSNHRYNVGSDNRQPQSKIDSVLTFAWTGLTIPAHGVVVKSVLLGCGSAGSLVLERTFSVDSDGDAAFDSVSTISGDTVTAPAAPVRTGFYFLGWNSEFDGSGTAYRPGEVISAVNRSVELFSQWKEIENTAIVSVTLDGQPWADRTVELYQDGFSAYTLAQTATPGTYQNAKVVNGTYDIYVNGTKSDQQLIVASTDRNITVTGAVAYKTVSVTTRLDGVPSSEPGVVTLRKNGSRVYTMTGTDGQYSFILQDSEGDYQIFVDGIDTNFTLSGVDPSKTIDFYWKTVRITDDAPWTSANVTLRNADGALTAVLTYAQGTENPVVYTKIVQYDPSSYEVFVDGRDAHKSLDASKSDAVDLFYYTSTVTIKGRVPASPVVSMTNGTDSCIFTGSAGSYQALHVLNDTDANDKEKPYTVTVKDTVDTILTQIDSAHKDAVLQFWAVEFYDCRSAADETQDKLVNTQYVRDTCLVPAYARTYNRKGYSFACWSESPWVSANGAGTPFDFTQSITRDIKLYTNYEKPTLIINGLVYTNAGGAPGGNGEYYRMANLTIKGFDLGSSAIKNIYLDVTNADSIQLLSTANATVTNGTTAIAAGGGAVTFTPTRDKIAIVFTNAVSMAEAQDYLRNQIIVKPTANMTHTIKVEVTDEGAKYRVANTVSASATSANMTQITSSLWTLSSGDYYVAGSTVVDKRGYAGVSGLSVASGAVVNLYIPTGATLTVYGGSGSGAGGAGAGIYVPGNSRLNVYGGGTLYAYGGGAASGGNGDSGTSGIYRLGGQGGLNITGNGGAGGAGGGGAGAGIGGVGGSGGSGGTTVYGTSIVDAEKHSNEGVNRCTGGFGVGGSGGSAGVWCGTISIDAAAHVYAYGGGSADPGHPGSDGGYATAASGFSGKEDGWLLEGGGGGGAGGGGGPAASIGQGGGGGGGGSGGSGGSDYNDDAQDMDTRKAGASGYGGQGGTANGGSGSSGRSGFRDGNGGQSDGGRGGDAGSGGGAVSTSVAAPASYTISYNVSPSGSGEPVASSQYLYSRGNTITLPAYADADPNVNFRGWQISTYAKSSVSGSPLTTASTKRYYAGDTVTLDPSTWGNITFTAVTDAVTGGIRDDDMATLLYQSSAPTVSYSTYKVLVRLDGATTTSKGAILIGGVGVMPGTDGSYTLVDSASDAKNVVIGGTSVGTVSPNNTYVVDYETMNVVVTGKTPQTVTLAGGPGLADVSDSSHIRYTTQRLAATPKGSYEVYVDGTRTGYYASYGNTVTVPFHTVSVTVNAHGTPVTSAELRDGSGNALPMSLADGRYSYTALVGSVPYTIYVNGESTGVRTDFGADRSLTVSYDRYTTTIVTQLDGALTDMGMVSLGGVNMVRSAIGTYVLTEKISGTAELKVDAKSVGNVTRGTQKTLNYYTVTYAHDPGDSGPLPLDDTRYLSGSAATMAANPGLTKGAQTFAGWTIGSTLYAAGAKAPITGKTTATATWKPTDFGTASEHFALVLGDANFTYNGRAQTPTVTVTRAGVALTEGTDYVISYENTNRDNGHSDAAGSNENAINAGTVTVTVTGRGDYSGTLAKTYGIAKARLVATGLKAADRVYDGTTAVELSAADAALTGMVEGDDVQLLRSSTGTLYSPWAREGKPVQIGAAQLTGAAVSEYALEPVEPVTVNITPKPLTEAMFTVADAEYDGTAKTPALTAADMATVDGSEVNLITAHDYSYTYSENIHAGTAVVTIRAGRPETDEAGNVTYSTDSNYSGSVTKTFAIHPAAITLTAAAASSAYGAPVADVSQGWTLTAGTIFTEADRADLAIHGVTTVQAGYDAKVYKGAVTAAWNTNNTDYKVTAIAADYTVTVAGAGVLTAASAGYAGVYDGKAHSIRVTPNLPGTSETVTVYYSTKVPLTAANYASTDAAVGSSQTNPGFTDVGTSTVYYYVTTPNCTGVSGSETVTITKAPLTVQAKAHSIVYGEDVSAIAAEAAPGNVTVTGLAGSDTAAVLTGSVTYTSDDYARYGGAGTYTLTPRGLSAKNYTITYAPGALTVTPKAVTFTWPQTVNFAYTGSEQSLQASVSGLVNGDAVTVGAYARDEAHGVRSTAAAVGDYTAKVTALAGLKAANYTFDAQGTSATQVWKISKAANSWTLTPAIASWKEGEAASTPTGQALYGSSTIRYTYSTAADGTYTETVPTAAGSYFMKAEITGTADYDGLTAGPTAFAVLSAAEETRPTIYAQPEDKTIECGAQAGSFTVRYTNAAGESVQESTLGLTGTAVYRTGYDSTQAAKRGVGTYAVTLSGQTSGSYFLVYRPGTLTVTPKTVSLTWSADTLPYTGALQTVTAAVNAADLLSGDAVTVSAYTGNTGTAAGSYTAQATALAGAAAANYRLPANAAHAWKITTAANSFVIQPAISGWIYGNAPSEPVASARFGTVSFQYQPVKEGVADWSIFNPRTSEVPTQAGTYRLIATVPAGDGYDKLESSTMEFTISPAQVLLTAQDAESVYGEAVQSPLLYTLSVVAGKLNEADKAALNVQLTTGVTANSAVGAYPITAGYTANSNCTVVTAGGIYTVKPKTQAVSAPAASFVYDGQAHTIAAPTAADGTALTDAVICYSTAPLTSQNFGSAAKTAPARTDVGTTLIYYYITSGSFAAVAGSTTLTVTPKNVTVTAKNTAIVYGEEAKNSGADYAGFVGSDTAGSLGLAPVYTYTTAGTSVSDYAVGSAAGSYRIVPSGLTAANYTFTYVPGTLTVAKKPLSEAMFALAADAADYSGAEQKPAVTGTDRTAGGLELLQSSDYTAQYAQNVHAGTARVTLTAAAAGNYTGTAEKTFTIRPLPITVQAEPAQSVYNMPLAALGWHVVSGSVLAGDTLVFTASTTVRKGFAAGVYKGAVGVDHTANGDYAVTVIPADYTVTTASMTASATDYRGTYDGKPHSASLTVKTGKLLTYAAIHYSAGSTVDESNYQTMPTEMPTFTDAGTYTVSYYAVCPSYTPVSGTVQVVILPAALSVTVPGGTLTYGDDPQTLLDALQTAEATKEQLTFSGFVGSDTAATAFTQGSAAVFAANYAQYGNAGSYQITVSGLTAKNYTLQYHPGTLTVQPKALTFTWPVTSYPYSGSEQQVTAQVAGKARASDEVAVGGCTGDRATAAGSYTAAVTSLAGAAAGNYTIAAGEASAVQAWTITPAQNRFLIAPSIADWVAGGTAAAPVAAAQYGTVGFTYSASPSGPFTAAVPTTAGSWYLRAAVPQTDNYTGLEQTVPFTILPAGSSLTTVVVTAPDRSLTYGDSFDPAALTQADAVVTGLPAGQTLADAASGTLTFAANYAAGSGAGSYLLSASGLTAKAGYTIQYRPGTITVAKKAFHLVWSADSFPYTGTAQTVSASALASDLVPGDSIVVTGYETNAAAAVRSTATEAGSYTAHAISFAGTNAANYTITDGSAAHAWSIFKAGEGGTEANSFTIAPAIAGWTYGSTPSAPTGAARFGTVRYVYASAADGAYTATVPTAAGSWFMKAIVDETASYNGLVSTPVPFTIAKARITLTANDVSSPAGSALAALTYTTGGTVRAGDSLGVKLATTAVRTSPVGEYPITVTYTANPNYEVFPTNGTYFVTPIAAALRVTAAGVDTLYDGTAHGITVTVLNTAGKVPADVKVYYSETELTAENYTSGALVSPTQTNAGTKKVYYYVASDQYAPISGSKDIVIEQKLVHVIAGNAAITYGDAPTDGGVTLDGLAAGETAQSLGLAPALDVRCTQYQDAGSYAIVPGTLPETGNYTFNYVNGTLTVAPKPVTLNWPNSTFTYDGTVKRSLAVVKGLVNGDVITVRIYADNAAQHLLCAAADTGTYTAQALALAGDKATSYVIAAGEPTASHVWTITQGTNRFLIAPTIADWIYGQTASQPQCTVLWGTPVYVYSTAADGDYTAQQPVDAGTYYLKALVPATANYPALESTPVAFGIAKAQITVVPDDRISAQGAALKELTYTVRGTVAAGDTITVTLSTTAAAASPVGEYPITAQVTASGNYTANAIPGIYHIVDAALDIDVTAQDVTAVYDGTEHGITVTVTGAAASGAAVYYSTAPITDTAHLATDPQALTQSPTLRDAGSLTVYYYVVSGTTVIGGSKEIRVTGAPLTILAGDATIHMGDEAANSGVTCTGFVHGEDLSALTGTLQYRYGTYTRTSLDGTYPITPYGVLSANYAITFVPGTLTVLPVRKPVTIVGVKPAENLVYNGQPQPGYTGAPAVSGNLVTDFLYQYYDENGTLLPGTPTDAGNYRLVISVPDSNKYYTGTVEVPFSIAKKTLTARVPDQGLLAGQPFRTQPVEYTGFVGNDNLNGAAFSAPAVVTPAAGSDLTKAGTAVLELTDPGTLTPAAAKNYAFATLSNGTLTIVAAAPGNTKPGDGPDGTGGSYQPGAGSGVIQTAVIKEPGLPPTVLTTGLNASVAAKLLSKDEMNRVKQGENALVYLMLTDADPVKDAAAETAISTRAQAINPNMKTGLFFNLAMFKRVGSEPPVSISKADTKVSVGVTLTGDLIQTDTTKVRTYTVFCLRNGVVSAITPTLKNGVLNFALDSFSTYSIAYVDTVKRTGGGSTPPADTGAGGGDAGSGTTTTTTPAAPTRTRAGAGTTTQPAAGTPGTAQPSPQQGGGQQPDTPAAQPLSPVPKETGDQLKDADDLLHKVDPGLHTGPIVRVPGKLGDKPDVRFTYPIPDDLRGKDRTFYLVGVGPDGSVIVLQNQSTEDGMFSATAAPGTVWQLMYEDGGAALAGHVADDGTVSGTDGNLLRVSTNHCFWHWIILLLALVGVVLEWFVRKRRKTALLGVAADAAVMILAMLFGWCRWDLPALLVGLIAVIAANLLFRRRKQDDDGNAAPAEQE